MMVVREIVVSMTRLRREIVSIRKVLIDERGAGC